MRFGIAFEGCAGRAAFHVGVAAWMLEQGLSPAAVAGASSGSIVAGALAAGRGQRLTDIWLAACGQPVCDFRRVLRGRWPFAMSDIVGTALRDYLGTMTLPQCPVSVAIPVTHLSARGRRRRVLTRRDDYGVVEAVLASCFMPGPYSRMVPIDARLTLDGAWQIRTPIEDLLGLDPSLDVYVACVANESGELRLGYPTSGTMQPPTRCAVLKPLETLPVGAYDLDPARMHATLEIGRRSARAFFEAR